MEGMKPHSPAWKAVVLHTTPVAVVADAAVRVPVVVVAAAIVVLAAAVVIVAEAVIVLALVVITIL